MVTEVCQRCGETISDGDGFHHCGYDGDNPAMLKHCPFCGSEELHISGDAYRIAWVECNHCRAEGPAGDTHKQAIKKWNLRV